MVVGKLLGCRSVDVDIERGRSGSALEVESVSKSSVVSFCSGGSLELEDAIFIRVLISGVNYRYLVMYELNKTKWKPREAICEC